MKPKHNIGNYLINELYRLNVRHIFGLPGDYILGFYDLLTRSNIAIINTCDEQGAGFAADAYARMRGIGAVCVTYCVGGLKVLNSTGRSVCRKITCNYNKRISWNYRTEKISPSPSQDTRLFNSI